jgi:polysaccharide export outer membrane protein
MFGCYAIVSRSNNNISRSPVQPIVDLVPKLKMIQYLPRTPAFYATSTGGADSRRTMHSSRRPLRSATLAAARFAALVLVCGLVPGVLSAQRRPVSRNELESAAKSAEAAGQRAQASRLRQRLKDGDFQPGHRIVLSVEGDSALTDTFTVRADRKLLVPNLPLISLDGVLESELEPYLQKELARYIRNPTVRVEPLLQLAVLGSVGQPGFYALPTDVTLGDALMQAGGPAQNADVRKMVVRRGSSTAVSKDDVHEAIRLGETLSDLGIRPGDELYVPDKSDGTKWTKVLTVVSAAAGLGYTLSWALRR